MYVQNGEITRRLPGQFIDGMEKVGCFTLGLMSKYQRRVEGHERYV